jgi:phosphoglycerol transferase MdoB-like AlkP superfamily enzyme
MVPTGRRHVRIEMMLVLWVLIAVSLLWLMGMRWRKHWRSILWVLIAVHLLWWLAV